MFSVVSFSFYCIYHLFQINIPIPIKTKLGIIDQIGTFYVPNPVITKTSIDSGVCNAIAYIEKHSAAK